MYNLPGKMAGIYRSGNPAQAYACFMFRSPALAYDHRDVELHKRLLREAFAGETSRRIKELLTAALADPDFYFDALCQVHMDSWFSGRVALVGDAAWCASPASGAGAELGLVGAYRLAGELAVAGGNHQLAFPRDEDSHRALVGNKQQIGLNVRLMVPKTAGGIRARNAFARLPLLEVMAGLQRRIQPTPEPLPDYAREDRAIPA